MVPEIKYRSVVLKTWRRLADMFTLLFLCGVASGQPNVPSGWYQSGDTIYRVERVAVDYTQASRVCEGYGATLAIVNTRDKSLFSADIISQESLEAGEYWIGLDDKDSEGYFMWADGTALCGRGQFRGNEPSDTGRNEDCVALTSSPSNPNIHGTWNDVPCTSQLRYVCSRRLVLTVLPQLSRLPTISHVGSHDVLIRWAKWRESRDDGDGPVSGYSIYIRNINDVMWISTGYLSQANRSSLEYNVTRLQPDTEYELSVSAIQMKSGLEGPKGPQITVRTIGTKATCSSTAAWVLFSLSLILNVIIIGTIAFLWYRRRRSRCDRSGSEPARTRHNEYEHPKSTKQSANSSEFL